MPVSVSETETTSQDGQSPKMPAGYTLSEIRKTDRNDSSVPRMFEGAAWKAIATRNAHGEVSRIWQVTR